ncbi:Transposase [Shigella dysenteriae 1617]|uniref:Transposase n=1 Tax=Shigella dysenteriae 1617 TaxID=754093 RepID=A0A0A6ZP10_SHIDY|nr:Transposase [Shigella dysenteriae 1617]
MTRWQKARQHWLWYAYNTKTGGVLAYTFGPRTDETCRELLALLTPFNIGMQNPKGHDRFRCRDCHRVFHRTLKAMTDFAAVTATAFFSSLTLMRPVSRALKS